MDKTRRFALTGGIVWALCLFVTTLFSIYTGYAKSFLDVVGSIYPGYSISLLGSIVGLIYGFFDVFVGVYIFAWIYKLISK